MHHQIFSPIFIKEDNFCDFLLAFLGDEALPNRGLLLQERICSCRSKFFPVRVDPIENGGKTKNSTVAFLNV